MPIQAGRGVEKRGRVAGGARRETVGRRAKRHHGPGTFHEGSGVFRGTGKKWRISAHVLARHGYGSFNYQTWTFVLEPAKRPMTP
jgi:hypothetical protein